MKNSKMITVIAVIALIAIVAVALVAGTFARYATTTTATATATTASWSFKAGLGTSTQSTINLYDTIENPATVYPNLATNKIAPGTTGTLNVVIDGTGSDVGIDYTVTLAMADSSALPTGLKFTADGLEFKKGTTTATTTGTIPLANVASGLQVPITWEWTLGDETTDANYDKTNDTGANNVDAAKSISLNVTIKGVQHIGTIS